MRRKIVTVLMLVMMAGCIVMTKGETQAAKTAKTAKESQTEKTQKDKDKKKTAIAFSNAPKKKLALYTGDKLKLKPDRDKVEKGSKFTYVSLDEKIVTVSKKGVVLAKKEGKAKIRVGLKKTKKSTLLRVSVKKTIPVKKIEVTTTDNCVFVGQEKKLSLKITPAKYTHGVTFESLQPDIASVDDKGVVKGLKEGTATILIKAENSKAARKKKIKVSENRLTKISLSKKKMVVGTGASEMLTVTGKPDYVTERKILWSSSDSSVASVNIYGRVYGHKTGTAIITATVAQNPSVKAECKITVSRDKAQLTKAMLDELDLRGINNLMIVAHPDDDTIWGGGHLAAEQYLVVCLTNKSHDLRNKEFNAAMDISGSKRIILDHPDWEDMSKNIKNNWEYEQLSIQRDIATVIGYKKWDTIVTHNPDGEYGHIHHRRTSSYVKGIYEENTGVAHRFMYFGKYYDKNALPAVEAGLSKLKPEIWAIKERMLEQYKREEYTCFTWLYHMQQYENWVYWDDWK
ncbi:MAG: Ig-like domain-containing protein [Lachnospiraceae bacterium]|nr:Ig-like domain-containing protein [Lachnospiraceae bacterium]